MYDPVRTRDDPARRRQVVIDRLLPPIVHSIEARSDDADEQLFAEELALVVDAVPERRREFATGRRLAREALADLGAPIGPLLPGVGGALMWPNGVVGSLTHCASYRAVAVAHSEQLLAVGVDAEARNPLPRGVLDLVSDASERRRSAELPVWLPWGLILFSAKEAAFKAWFSATQCFLEFRDISVDLSADGSFAARLGKTPDEAWSAVSGRWLATSDLIVTAVVVPRD